MSGPTSSAVSIAPIILLNGLPVKTTYMANCRLCLGSNFGDKSTTIVEGEFSNMLRQVFCFPLPNKIGLPMNVCSKCRRGVELFFKYTNKVIANQKKLEGTFIGVSYQQTGNVASVDQNRAHHLTMDRQSNVVEIVSDDESEQDDNVTAVDMQCDPVTNNRVPENDPLLQPSVYEDPQINFVEVPCSTDIFADTETYGLEHITKRGKKRMTEAPLAMETIYLSDDESEESAEPVGHLRKKNGGKTQLTFSTAQPSRRTTSHAAGRVDATIESVVTDGVTMVYYEADESDGTCEEITITALPSKRNVSSTIKEPHAKQRLQEHKSSRHSRTSEKGHKNL